jgi:hypothetical protein
MHPFDRQQMSRVWEHAASPVERREGSHRAAAPPAGASCGRRTMPGRISRVRERGAVLAPAKLDRSAVSLKQDVKPWYLTRIHVLC